jgi:hypothetical protein
MAILAQLASDDVLSCAYEWLCRRRRDYSANSDVWALRRNWPREQEQIRRELLSGNYRFSLLSRITLKDGEDTDLMCHTHRPGCPWGGGFAQVAFSPAALMRTQRGHEVSSSARLSFSRRMIPERLANRRRYPCAIHVTWTRRHITIRDDTALIFLVLNVQRPPIRNPVTFGTKNPATSLR